MLFKTNEHYDREDAENRRDDAFEDGYPYDDYDETRKSGDLDDFIFYGDEFTPPHSER